MDDVMTDRELVFHLCQVEEGLTEWEVSFVESLAKWLETRSYLSDKQRARAGKIFDEHC